MRPRTFLSLSLIAACLGLCGCNTTAVSDEQLYVPPAGPTVAHITGTQQQDTGLFGSRHVAYVLLVNGKFVRDAEESANQALALNAGPQEIAVEYRSSIFRSRTVFTLEAKPGARYVLRMALATSADDRRTCDFVIVDAATGEPVTPVKRTNVAEAPGSNRSNFRPLD